MPKQARELSALEIKRLTKPGHHAAGGVSGLLLQITETGSKSWILRAIVGAKRRDIGLGGFPGVTLAQARINARELKEQIRSGIDPVEQRKAAKAALISANGKLICFADAAHKFLTAKRSEFKNAKHAAQWQTTPGHNFSPAKAPTNGGHPEFQKHRCNRFCETPPPRGSKLPR